MSAVDVKPWWQSKTVWASVGTVVLGLFGVSGADPAEFGEMMSGLVVAVSGLVALYGRVTAKKTIGKKDPEVLS